MDDTEDPKLSDVIGGLVSSMVHARTVADMEALRIAYHYRQNEFLQGLPIPRLRLQKVSISMPVVLTSVQPGRQAKARHPIEIAEAVYAILPAALDLCRKNVKNELQLAQIGPEQKTTLERILRLVDFMEREESHGTPKMLADELAVALGKIGVGAADARTAPSDIAIRQKTGETVKDHCKRVFKEYVFQYIQGRLDDQADFDHKRARDWFEEVVGKNEHVELVIRTLSSKAEASSVLESGIPPDFTVSVNTAEVKNEGGGADTVTRLNLVLHEEGLEWMRETADDGTVTSRLMPE